MLIQNQLMFRLLIKVCLCVSSIPSWKTIFFLYFSLCASRNVFLMFAVYQALFQVFVNKKRVRFRSAVE